MAAPRPILHPSRRGGISRQKGAQHPEPETRTPEPASRRSRHSTSPVGEVPAKPGVGAPASSPSPSHPSSASVAVSDSTLLTALAAGDEPLEVDDDDAHPCDCPACTAERAAADAARGDRPTSPRGGGASRSEAVGAPVFPPSATDSSSAPAASPSLPVSDSTLLTALAAGQLDPEQIARQHRIRLDLFLDWMSSPETIRRLNALIQGRAHVKQQAREAIRDEALDNLVRLQREAIEREDPVEARRASIGILRFTSRNSAPLHLFSAGGLPAGAGGAGSSGRGGPLDTLHALNISRYPAHYRTRSRHIRAMPLLREAPMILPGPSFPTAADSPAAATIKLLQRLQDSDNPTPGDGLRSLYNYFTPAWRTGIQVKSADEFARTDLFGYIQLIGHHSAVLHPTQLPDGLTDPAAALAATQQAEFTDLDGFAHRVVIKFTRASTSAPWLIDDIRLAPPSRPEPAPPPPPTPGPAP